MLTRPAAPAPSPGNIMNRTSAVLACLFLLGPAASPALGADAVQPGALRVQRVEIVDRQGFEKPLVAATMMLPAGWRHDGAVEWNVRAKCTTPYGLRLRAEAPDRSAAIELLPGEGWGATTFGAHGECPPGNFRSAQEYLRAWVQRHRPGARWLDYRARPDKSREGMRHDLPGGSLRSWLETGQALIGYQQDGRDVRETVAVAINFAHSEFSGIGGARMQSLSAQSLGALAGRAPHGRLDFRQFDAVWQTLRREPEWHARISAAEQQMAQENAATQRRIGQIQGQMSRDTMNEIAKRGQIMAQTRADIAAMQNQAYASRDATTDRMQRDSVKTIREIETYREPRTGGVVELPNHYRHAWRLNDGTYLLTDSQAFEPGRDLGIAGERMQAVR